MKVSEKKDLESLQKYFEGKEDVFFAPEGDWIDLTFPEKQPLQHDREKLDGGIEVIRVDHQRLLLSDVQARYIYCEERILNSSGVNSASQIELEVMPTFQKVVVHKIQINRNGIAIDKIPSVHLQVAQNDRTAEGDYYQSFKYLSLVISDIQIDDILAFSYTIYGSDPAAQNHFGVRFNVGSFSPVGYKRIRVLAQKNKEIFIRNYKHDHQPTIADYVNFPDAKEYIWDLYPQDVCKFEGSTPPGYRIIPYIEISDFSSWADVVNTVLPYFKVDEESRVLESVLQEIEEKYDSLTDRAIACLDYVQKKIRYRNFNEIHLTYKPVTSEEVLRNGFGDCKDKTLLLLYMLKYFKIQACPALISFSDSCSIRNALPFLGAFDHVLVYAKIDHVDYWLDPTYRNQEGDANVRYTLNEEYALVLRKSEKDLTWVPKNDHSYKEIKETFDFRDETSTLIPLNVETVCHGHAANTLRSQLEDESLFNITKRYTEFYETYYPGVENTKSLIFHDDKKTNTLSLQENYLLDKEKSFQREGEGFVFTPYDLRNSLSRIPAEAIRIHPFAVTYPLHLKHTIEILLPGKAGYIDSSMELLCDQAFRLEFTCRDGGDKVIFTFTHKTLKDHVLAEDLPEFCENLQKAYAMISRIVTPSLFSKQNEEIVTQSKTKSENLSWVWILVGLCGWLGFKAIKIIFEIISQVH